MNREKTIFVCSECGEEYAKWSGKCLSCGQWNTLKEFKSQKSKVKNKSQNSKLSEVVDLNKIESQDFQRISTGIGEVDRVLGSGIVPGSVILLGGDPGIGKSTLLLQIASNLVKINSKPQTLNSKQTQNSNVKTQNRNLKLKTYPLPRTPYTSNSVLYVSGEESAEQVKMRLDRLVNKTDNLQFLAETDIDAIISKLTPRLRSGQAAHSSPICIIDSIQTMYDANFPSTPGSLVQVRECALRLQQFAKQTGTSVILVGHVTKEGNVAGPRTLEHLVDVVLYLEGERHHQQRILRGVKNRFGATDEMGVFTMTEGGLGEVSNPSQLFLAERIIGQAGSVVTVTLEGNRPILLEIQALTNKTIFGYPKRTSSGFDLNRLNLLVAVLSKKLQLALDSQDIYINVVGGFKLKDPAVDLAVGAAIISAYKDKAIDAQLCLFGEIGLLGEVRKVQGEKKRVEEARRLGFQTLEKIKTLEELVKMIM